MNYRSMNGTGVKVSELCLGTMMFGGKTSKEESLKIIDYAINHGVNYIDTADIYTKGESERIVGEALKGRRNNIFLATKVRYTTGEDINDRGLNRYHIMKQVEESLKSLQTDHIDLYYLHAMDPEVDFDEMLDTMSMLVRSGKVRYVGVSNFPAWQISEMQWLSEKKHYVRPIVTQNLYNLLARDSEIELVPCIERHKVGLTTYNPIAGGLLTGKYDLSDLNKLPTIGRIGENTNYQNRYWNPAMLSVVRDLSQLAKEHERSLLELSLKWTSAHAYVDSVICGVSSLEQIKQNIEAINKPALSEALFNQANEISERLREGRIHYFKD